LAAPLAFGRLQATVYPTFAKKEVQKVCKMILKMLATLITRDCKQVWRTFLVADLQYYSIKRPKSGNLEKQKKSGKKYFINYRYRYP
jgi:hypothetical protein